MLGRTGVYWETGESNGVLGEGVSGEKMGYLSLYGGAQKAAGVLGKGPTWVCGCVLGHPGV